jgi:hypothetical protein
MPASTTVYLDPGIWEFMQAKLATPAQAIRLQELVDQAMKGKNPEMNKRDQALVNRYALFVVPIAPPMMH